MDLTRLVKQKAPLPVVNATGFEKAKLVLHSVFNYALKIKPNLILNAKRAEL